MSLVKNGGTPIAIIGNTEEYIGIDEEGQGVNHVILSGEDRKFSLCPLPDRRTKVYIAGPTGCGKTYFAVRFLQNYSSMYPENDVLILTEDPEDPTITQANLQNMSILDLDDEDTRYDLDLS